MRTPLLLALAWAAACAGPPEPVRTPPGAVKMADRLPRRSELPCFPCHSQIVFEKGPRFAHASVGHRDAGHCHRCHQGMGHQGRAIDLSACLACHQDGPPTPDEEPGR